MIRIYQKINDQITETQVLAKDCWVNIAPPFNMDKLEEFSRELDIPFSFIIDCIDLYERSRYEKVEDAKLIVINTPILNEYQDIDDQAAYITVPVGIVLLPDKIITINSLPNPMIEWFEKNTIKNLPPEERTMFILKIFERNVNYFLHYLREINKRISQVEKELQRSAKNEELNKLLQLQKSLVYFVNDLRANEMVMLKIQRTDFLGIYENQDARDFLQDIMIDNSQAMEMANVYSNILNGTMDFFNSIISNNLNVVVSRLTSVTIILMIPTIIASFFGMNVHLPFSDAKFAFSGLLIFSILISILLSVWFRRKNWL